MNKNCIEPNYECPDCKSNKVGWKTETTYSSNGDGYSHTEGWLECDRCGSYAQTEEELKLWECE